MIDTQAIRKKVLDLALRGKLTEQLPEDGTADELYRQITAENKSRKNGKSAQQYPIEEEMIPCSIPDNWIWTKVGNLITLVSGTDFKPEDYNEAGNGLPYMTGASNIDGDQLIINRWTTVPRNISYKGDLLLVCNGSGFGRLVLNNVPEVHIARQFMAIRPFDGLNVNYIKAVMENSFNTIKEAGKGLIPGVDRETVLNLYLPLPPLAEQQRIVEKIESLFSVLCTIDTLQSQYQDNLATLKSKIIDAGIQGKLTEQLPEDGTAEELYHQIQQEKLALEKAGKIKKSKPLPPISDEEKPFDIPDNWKWVRWGDIVNIVSARRVHQSDWKNNGIPFYRAREIAKLAETGYVDNDLFISEELYNEYAESGVPRYGDLMVSAVGTLGKTYVVQPDDKFYYKDASVLCFENYGKVSPYYLSYLMRSQLMKKQIESNSGGTTVDTLTMVRMVQYILPLPPLAEQKRIVTKLEELLPLCEG